MSKNYKVGSVIEYSPFGGGCRRVVVEEKEDDIKNGRPGFSGHQVGAGPRDGLGGGVWGYDDQIIRVVSE